MKKFQALPLDKYRFFFFGCVKRSAFPYEYPGDFWCEMVAFYCLVLFR